MDRLCSFVSYAWKDVVVEWAGIDQAKGILNYEHNGQQLEGNGGRNGEYLAEETEEKTVERTFRDGRLCSNRI